ncbi:MAG: hypothetical protein ING25_00005 [Burkholderiales bacterium]|jgi:hypothetical protein|nr:hypothetical protein [Burkholderiales bacterium]
MDDSAEFQSLCAAIGFVEINWALFEQSLDCIVLSAHRDLGGSAIDKNLPRSYSSKAKFLRKAFSKVEALNPLKEEAEEVLSHSDELSTKRHDLMHGVVTHVKAVDGCYTFSKIDYVGQDHSYREFVFSPEDFPTLADCLLSLGAQTTRLGVKVDEIAQRLSTS